MCGQNYSFFDSECFQRIFSLGVDGKDSVMSVCAMKREARGEFYRKCPFKDCTVAMKFIDDKNEQMESIFKGILCRSRILLTEHDCGLA